MILFEFATHTVLHCIATSLSI